VIMSLTIQGPTLNVTEYMQTVSKIAADSNCGVCLPTAISVVDCDRCQITVNVTYSAARRLLSSTATLDTSIATSDLATAATLVQKLNTTASKQTISTSLGGMVIFMQPPQIIVVVVPILIPPSQTSAPSSSSSNTLIIVMALAAVVLLAVVGVVVYLVMRPSSTEIHIHNNAPGQVLGRRMVYSVGGAPRREPVRQPSVQGGLIYRMT